MNTPKQKDPNVVTLAGGREYVTRTGRRSRMDVRFGAGGFDVDVQLPPADEYAFIRQMLGLKDGDPLVVVKAVVSVDGKPKYKDYATATPDNVQGGAKQFKLRGLEIATTRAINRAMGQGISDGFSTEEQKYQPRVAPAPNYDFLRQCNELKKKIAELTGSPVNNSLPEEYYATLISLGYAHTNDPRLNGNPEAMATLLDALEDVVEVLSGGTYDDVDDVEVPEKPVLAVATMETEPLSMSLGSEFNTVKAMTEPSADYTDVIEEKMSLYMNIAERIAGVDEMQSVSPSGGTYAENFIKKMSDLCSKKAMEDIELAIGKGIDFLEKKGV